MDYNIELKLVGITYNQIESGVYALILEDPVKKRRLAIVIGYPEAQSIECHLQKVRTPRPLAHDLLANIISQLDAELLRVDIHKLPTGPYAGKLTLQSLSGETIEIDARSSDAIALAIRVGAPIFTNSELIEKEGYIPQPTGIKSVKIKAVETASDNPYATYSFAQLQEMLEMKVAEENYEEAAEIQKEISRRIALDDLQSNTD